MYGKTVITNHIAPDNCIEPYQSRLYGLCGSVEMVSTFLRFYGRVIRESRIYRTYQIESVDPAGSRQQPANIQEKQEEPREKREEEDRGIAWIAWRLSSPAGRRRFTARYVADICILRVGVEQLVLRRVLLSWT